MTIWYRASFNDHLKVTFSGEGGLYVIGRWNYQGRKVIYCSQSIALCTLEWLAHNGLSVSGFSYYRYSINIPDKYISKFSVVDLPKDWAATPATDSTRDFAEKHLFSSNKIGICIPSVIVPEEFNLIINPMHDGFLQVVKSIQSLGKYISPTR